jgi:predicted small lipoprotein YifL
VEKEKKHMKKNLFVALALSGAAIMTLAGCGNKAPVNSQNLPATTEEVVAKVASLAAICQYSNGQTLKAGSDNTIPAGKSVIVATSYTIQAWDGSQAVNTTATLTWSLATTTGWKVTEKSPDDVHNTILGTTPAFGKDALTNTLTGTISYNGASADVVYSLTLPASTTAPKDYKSMATLRADYDASKVKKDTFVQVYGYVVGFYSDYSKVILQNGSLACVVYGSGALFSNVAMGDLWTVQGNVEDYYKSLELVGSTSAKKYAGTDIAAVVPVTVDETVIGTCTTDGWSIGSTYGAVTAVLASASGKYSFTVGTKSLTPYYNSYTTATVKTAASALLTAANVGKTFALKGIFDSYKGAPEIIPVNATDWALA